MKLTVFVAAFFVCNFLVSAQSDSSQVQELIEIGNRNLRSNNLDSANWVVSQVYNLYNTRKWPIDVSHLRVNLMEATILERQGLHADAIRVVENAMANFDVLIEPNNGISAMLWTKHAALENRMGRYKESLVSALKAKEFALSRDVIKDRITINALMTLSSAHFRLYQTREAIAVTEQALHILEALYGVDHPSTARLLSNLANRYKDLRRFDKALHFLRRAQQIQLKHFGEDGADLALTHYNIALNLESKNLHKEAIAHYEKSANITSKYVQNHPYLAEDHQKIGACYVNLQEYEKALLNYQIASDIYERLPEEHVSRMGLLHAYAKLYEAKQEYPEAVNYIEQTLEFAREKLGANHPKIAGYLGDKAYYLTELGRFMEAEHMIMTALEMLAYDPANFDPRVVTTKNHLYHQLAMAGYVHLSRYRQKKDTSELFKALKYYQDAIKVLDLVHFDLQEDKSKVLLRHQTIGIYEHLLETIYSLFEETGRIDYIELAIQTSELSRRSTVLEAVLARQVDRFPGVPAEIYRKERKISSKIINIENQINSMILDQSHGERTIDSLRAVLFTHRIQLYGFLDSLDTRYPKYYHHRHAVKIPDIQEFQSSMDNSQCILEYFDGKDHIYLLALTTKDLAIRRIEKNAHLEKHAKKFLIHLTNPDTVLANPETSLHELRHSAHALYYQLVQPILQNLDVQEILIVPDGIEAKLPFEVFLVEDPKEEEDPGNWPYLFRKHQIYYAQSIMAWYEQLSLNPRPVDAFAGFAPAYQKADPQFLDTMDQSAFALLVRNGHIDLPGAKNEVLEIQKIVSGDVFIGKNATERQFVEKAGQHQILHVSAHTLINNENPDLSKFIFSKSNDSIYDDALTAAEITRLELSADLAVLSACQTGSGKTNRGEGVMSLGRAFSFAGIPTTLLSLWKVPDASTSRLMPAFYQGLKEGLPKPEALNKARLTYLSKVNTLDQKHPYFWAGFVLYGNSNALVWSKRTPKLLWPSLSMLIVLGVFFWWKFR